METMTITGSELVVTEKGDEFMDDLNKTISTPVETADETAVEPETTSMTSEDVEPTKVNYIAEFYKSGSDHGYDKLFTGAVVTKEVEELNKVIKKAQKKINEASTQIKELYSKQYGKKYTPASKVAILEYRDRNNKRHYYSVPAGQGIDIDMFDKDEYCLYELYNKTGYVTVLAGYALEQAGIITKEYEVKISTDNSSCKLNLVEERFRGFLDDVMVDSITNTLSVDSSSKRIESDMSEFISLLYGVNKKTTYSFDTLKFYREHNASFETVIKSAPECISDRLIKEKFAKSMGIPELIGIQKNTYKAACDRNLVAEVFELADLMAPEHEHIFHKSEMDWLGLLEVCKNYEKDLEFYSVGVGSAYYLYSNRGSTNTILIRTLAETYKANAVFQTNYSLPKFMKYVVDGTIDQVYTNISSFITELRDYLVMCERQGAKPTLYSSSLKQTHDIAARNHTIKVSAEDEELFKSRYDDFKPYITKDKEFRVIAPDSTTDLRKEGDNLSHCVMAYSKKVIDGDCLILFLRKDETESLLTLEIKGSQIIQARGMNNRNPYEDEIAALKEFCEEREYELNY